MFLFSTPGTGISFGLSGQTPAASTAANISFGTPKPASGFNFGAPASTVTPFSTPQQQPTFGLSNPTATAAVAPQQQSTGLSFGLSTPATTNTVQPLSFSTPAQPSTGFSFGQTPQATTAAVTTSTLSFGLPSATQSTAQKPVGLTLGQPSAAPAAGFSFGQQNSASTAPTALSFGLQATTTAVPTLTLNPLTTTTPSTGLSFGQPSSQAPPLFGASQQPGGLSLLPTTSAVPASNDQQSVGLGGIDMNTTQPKAAEGKSESTKVKEAQVPKEIIQTIEDFKAYVKQQKTLSSDIIRTTDRKLKSVTDETKRLNSIVQEVSNNVDNNKLAIKLLRSDTARIIQHADMAQRKSNLINLCSLAY